MRRRNGHLVRFDGPIALMTSGRCASACLDFADHVRSVPGAIHLGRETGADSVYIDIAFVQVASGIGFMTPLKVFEFCCFFGEPDAHTKARSRNLQRQPIRIIRTARIGRQCALPQLSAEGFANLRAQ